MDTTSNALSRILHQLSIHPDAQKTLRAELVEATNGGTTDLDYDTLMKLPYLDAVCRETLRLFAPVTLSGRACVFCLSVLHSPSELVPLFLLVRPKISFFPFPSPSAVATGSYGLKWSYPEAPSSSHTSKRATRTRRFGARTQANGSPSAGSRRSRRSWRRRIFPECIQTCAYSMSFLLRLASVD